MFQNVLGLWSILAFQCVLGLRRVLKSFRIVGLRSVVGFRRVLDSFEVFCTSDGLDAKYDGTQGSGSSVDKMLSF